MAIAKVGVVGCGQMGGGIAQVCAQKGYAVVVREVADDLLQRGLGNIRKFLAKSVEKGKLAQADADATLGRLKGTTRLEDLADCDVVIEAIVENLDAKKALFAELDKACKPSTILATNTSSISVTSIAAATKRPARVLGLHFMNPVPIMQLIEIVRPEVTSEETYREAKAFGESLGKTIVTAKDTPGFIVNYLLIPYLCEAIRALEHGLATKEDIDNGMKLGTNQPMGPITLSDFIGLDTVLYIADVLHEGFRDPRFAAPPLLRRMVTLGRLGVKTGAGFYEHAKK